MAEDVRAIVRAAGHRFIRLEGADIGAIVAYAYASRHPDKVDRFVFGETLVPGFGLEELMNPATGGYWHFGFHAQAEVPTMLTQGRKTEYLPPSYAIRSMRDGAVIAERAYLPFYPTRPRNTEPGRDTPPGEHHLCPT